MTRPEGPSGLLVVDKPAGITSHGVVSRVRRAAGTRKVGHAGTLDPMATGVLVLGLGRATRLLGHLMLTEKAYDATVRLGVATTTDDAEGETLAVSPVGDLTEERVREALAGFVGDIEQVPSAVSAIKVDGRRAYERVRAGEEVALKARPVTVHAIEVSAVTRPTDAPDALDVAISVRCSSGTYIRAIARDLGAALEVGGHLTALRRTAVGGATLAEAVPLDRLQEGDEVPLMRLDEAARRFFPVLEVDAEQQRAVGFGRRLDVALGDDLGAGPFAVLGPDGSMLALYERDPDGPGARPVAVLAPSGG